MKEDEPSEKDVLGLDSPTGECFKDEECKFNGTYTDRTMIRNPSADSMVRRLPSIVDRISRTAIEDYMLFSDRKDREMS